MQQVQKQRASFTLPSYARYGIIAAIMIAMPWIITVLPFFGANNSTYSALNNWIILAIVCIGLNVLIGFTGMISLGHASLFAIGAYITGYFTTKAGLPFYIALLFGGIGTVIFALILALPALRLSGPYLAVATFGFGVAVPQLLARSKEINNLFKVSLPGNTGIDISSLGILKVSKQNLPGAGLEDDLSRYFLFLIIFAIMTYLAINLSNSQTGRALRSVRDSETAAMAMGVSLGRYKILAFLFSGFYAGIGGGLFAAQVGLLDANSPNFSPLASILFLTAIVVGGLGSIWGSVIGAGVLTLLPRAISSLNDVIKEATGTKVQNFEQMFYGVLIIVFVFFMPYGITGAWMRWRARSARPAISETETVPVQIESLAKSAADASEDRTTITQSGIITTKEG